MFVLTHSLSFEVHSVPGAFYLQGVPCGVARARAFGFKATLGEVKDAAGKRCKARENNIVSTFAALQAPGL